MHHNSKQGQSKSNQFFSSTSQSATASSSRSAFQYTTMTLFELLLFTSWSPRHLMPTVESGMAPPRLVLVHRSSGCIIDSIHQRTRGKEGDNKLHFQCLKIDLYEHGIHYSMSNLYVRIVYVTLNTRQGENKA